MLVWLIVLTIAYIVSLVAVLLKFKQSNEIIEYILTKCTVITYGRNKETKKGRHGKGEKRHD